MHCGYPSYSKGKMSNTCSSCKPDREDYYPWEEHENHHNDNCEYRPPKKHDDQIQTHTHEFAGSGMIAGAIPHNHRFAGVTSEEIPYGKSHIHAILTNDDFFFNHHHEVGVRTGPAIKVGDGKHVHFVEGETTTNFGHHHDFVFTTYIENPLQKCYK